MVLLDYYPKVEKLVIDEYYFTAAQGVVGSLESSSLTPVGEIPRIKEELLPDNLQATFFCVLSLENGHCATGSYTFHSFTEADETEGKELARKEAVRKLLPIVHYLDKQAEYDQFQL